MRLASLMLASSYLAMSGIAFAAADAKGSGKPTPIAAAAPAATGISAIRSDIAIPPKSSGGRGGATLYPFDKLEIGQSFGVVGKTQKGMASTVSSANKRALEVVKDGAGKAVVVNGKELTRPTKRFVSGAVDPATDPDKASVRIWRIALDAAPVA